MRLVTIDDLLVCEEVRLGLWRWRRKLWRVRPVRETGERDLGRPEIGELIMAAVAEAERRNARGAVQVRWWR